MSTTGLAELKHRVLSQHFVSQIRGSQQFAEFLSPQLFFNFFYQHAISFSAILSFALFIANLLLGSLSHKNAWKKLFTCHLDYAAVMCQSHFCRARVTSPSCQSHVIFFRVESESES